MVRTVPERPDSSLDLPAPARDLPLWVSLAAAALFWYLIFGLKIVNFWLGMALAASALAAWAWRFGGPPWRAREWNRGNILLGILGAVALYGIFVAGNYISRLVFDFAAPGIASVYGIRGAADLRVIAPILLFITSPAEEMFWRGFVQARLARHWQTWPAWLAAAALYAAVHISSGNPMLVLAALVAGLFWGLIFALRRSLVPLVISHALWTMAIFVLFPLA